MDRWKQKHNVTLQAALGEENAVTREMTASSNETYLQTILTKYKLKDIYNVDGFVLFYQALPDKSSHYKGERCSDGKHSKVRLTGLAANDAMGEKLPMFVIGKSAKPRLWWPKAAKRKKKFLLLFFICLSFFFLFCFVFALIL